MAFIAHRCECGHLDTHHDRGQGSCSDQACGCTGRHGFGDPEIAPTWDVRGRPITTVAEPGTKLPQLRQTCDCDDCQELYHNGRNEGTLASDQARPSPPV